MHLTTAYVALWTASHAITPDDAAYFRLADYARATIQYKYNVMSTSISNRNESTSDSSGAYSDGDSDGDGNISGAEEDSEAVVEAMPYGDARSESKRVPPEGAGDEDRIPKVVVKTDTGHMIISPHDHLLCCFINMLMHCDLVAVSLGTVLDAIEEFEERCPPRSDSTDGGAGGSDEEPGLPLLQRIVRGEAGIVTTADVHIATAAGGECWVTHTNLRLRLCASLMKITSVMYVYI
jgi:hypothetical protein